MTQALPSGCPWSNLAQRTDMARRKAVNRTGLQRIEGVRAHAAWVGFVCLECSTANVVKVADLSLLASREPVVNPNVDVNACVSRFLNVRERSGLAKRLTELKRLLMGYGLVPRLSAENRSRLGFG